MYFKAFALTGRIADCLIPRALPWAKSFCPFRACCCGLLGLLGVAAYMGILPFLGVLLWAFGPFGRAAGSSWPFGRCCCGLLGLLGVLLWASWPFGRCCYGFKLPSTPFCTVEFTQHALKGQKLLAQGNALGINDIQLTPCKGKSFTYRRGFSYFY